MPGRQHVGSLCPRRPGIDDGTRCRSATHTGRSPSDTQRPVRGGCLDGGTTRDRRRSGDRPHLPARANPDHAALLGYDAAALDRVNRQSVELLADVAGERSDELVGWEVGGMLGPRGDGYATAGPVDLDVAADYHRPQLESFRAAGASRATVLTLTEVGEAIGVARAAADVGIPAAIGFTVETDGRLPDGTSLASAIEQVDAVAPPAYFLVNCAHPSHVLRGLDEGPWRDRVGGLRCNASTMSHAELDAAEELDGGDPVALAADQQPLLDAFGDLEVLGGCCGTDARHVAAMWGVS
ncbi:homocysteine S-methyltransferase family protein [Nocardioides sp. J9]|uniref:homocysteine S-methyltransferase family protein n=1 Tax=Nocardioides sp. J9 TaxID=935844 RepID=UPI001648B3E2|nr:homocysteine S-methyltransferase family protein [Nocardioides sp. J9]